MVLAPIATLIGVYLGHYLTLRYENLKEKKEGRINSYKNFIKLLIENSQGKSINAEDLWNCCISIQKYGEDEIKTQVKPLILEIEDSWIKNKWNIKIEEYQSTSQYLKLLGPKVIPKIREDLSRY